MIRRSWSSSPMFLSCRRRRPAGKAAAAERRSGTRPRRPAPARAGRWRRAVGGRPSQATRQRPYRRIPAPGREPPVSGMFGNCEGPRAACTVAEVPVSHPLAAPAPRTPRGDGRFDVGIAGAGQLARMTCLAAWPLGIRVAVLGRPGEPAAPDGGGRWSRATGTTRTPCARSARPRGVVTLENEFVDAAALASVQAAGTPVRPGAGRAGPGPGQGAPEGAGARRRPADGAVRGAGAPARAGGRRAASSAGR